MLDEEGRCPDRDWLFDRLDMNAMTALDEALDRGRRCEVERVATARTPCAVPCELADLYGPGCCKRGHRL